MVLSRPGVEATCMPEAVPMVRAPSLILLSPVACSGVAPAVDPARPGFPGRPWRSSPALNAPATKYGRGSEHAVETGLLPASAEPSCAQYSVRPPRTSSPLRGEDRGEGESAMGRALPVKTRFGAAPPHHPIAAQR